MAVQKERVFSEVTEALGLLAESKTDRQSYRADTGLLGANHVLDSLKVISLVAWCDETYGIDLLQDDLELTCLQSVGTLVERICSLLEKK